METENNQKISWDGINRRRFIRVKYPFTVHIYLPGESPISTYTEDISVGGVRVTIKQEIPEAALVDLELYLRIDPIICKGKVSWIKTRESKFLEDTIIHDVGVQFSKVKAGDKKDIKKQVADLLKTKKDEEEASS